jgi:S-DNA-T family DNA segregation ATPase FtsK/SpoIIIE
VEEKRAREREQLAAWYQPVPEPAHEPARPVASVPTPTPPTAASVVPVACLKAPLPMRGAHYLVWQKAVLHVSK